MTVYVVATTEPNWLLFAFCQAVWPISAIYSYYMTYLKVWPLKIPIGLSAGNKMINVTKSADFIKDVHSQQNNIKKNNVSSTGLLTTRSGWLRPRPRSATCWSAQFERGPARSHVRRTQVSWRQLNLYWNCWTRLKLVKTRWSTIWKGPTLDSQGINSILNLITIKSEMADDIDDLISSQSVAALSGKIFIFYQFTNQFRLEMRSIKL